MGGRGRWDNRCWDFRAYGRRHSRQANGHGDQRGNGRHAHPGSTAPHRFEHLQVPPPSGEGRTAPAPGPSTYEWILCSPGSDIPSGRSPPTCTSGRALAPAVDADEMGDGAVVGALRLRREDAAWQLAHPPVVADALAAFALSRAGLVGAGALCQILFYFALHILYLRRQMIPFLGATPRVAIQGRSDSAPPPDLPLWLGRSLGSIARTAPKQKATGVHR